MKIPVVIAALFISFYLQAQTKPNVVIIYADDLGYGDVSSYGARKIITPHIDALAKNGLQFTNGHSTSATCTPSRYALMTGVYPWRKAGTGVLPGDAALIITNEKITLPSLFQQQGYTTGIVGKWHLGLGEDVAKNWNAEVKPGPNEIGFDYAFIFPATADRVPTVFLENHQVVALDTSDPIEVSYKKKVGNDPTLKEAPELAKMKSSHGHDGTIVNGIGRIGFMSGGKKARWTDEELPFTFLEKAKGFISAHQTKPFFLFYSLTEPHVPRMPSTMFKEKSGLGYRGDAILQLDWAVGEIIQHIKDVGLEKNTIIIFSSDNGPVLDDGYRDGAVERLNGHTPAGPLRGGKYSTFEAGTRVPFIVKWPAVIKPGISNALISQIDLLGSFAFLLKKNIPEGEARDSKNIWNAITGKSATGRITFIEQGSGNALAVIKNNWKYIEPDNRSPFDTFTNTELGFDKQPQLYNLEADIGEKNNIADKHPEIVKELAEILMKEKR